ncbi:hypothetical protein BGX26_002295, partial [Mortierella sp. AD094]
PTEMREELRRRRPTKDEKRPKLQYTRYEQYKEQTRACFEHIITEVREENILDFRIVENGDELAEDALQQVDIEGEGQGDKSEDEGSRDESLRHDGSASSPIPDVDFDATIQTLKYLAGDQDVLTIDGLKHVRRFESQ